METKTNLRDVAYKAGRVAHLSQPASWSDILGLPPKSFSRLTEKAQEGIIDAYCRGALDALAGGEL